MCYKYLVKKVCYVNNEIITGMLHLHLSGSVLFFPKLNVFFVDSTF
jgi:hypothetical protein